MIYLPQTEWGHIRSLINTTCPFLSIRMAVERRLACDVWVDRQDDPTCILVMFRHDAFAWGNVRHPGFSQLLSTFDGTIPETVGLEDVLKEAWDEYVRIPTTMYTLATIPLASRVPAGDRKSVV